MSTCSKQIILIIAYGFFPAKQYGGPPVSVRGFSEQLSDEYDIRIVTRNHDLRNSSRLDGIAEGWNRFKEGYQVLYLSDRDFSLAKCMTIVDEVKPSLIYFQSFFAAQVVIPFLFSGIRRGIPILIASRGEFLEAAIRQKKYKKIPYLWALGILGIKKRCYFQATSMIEADAIKQTFSVDSSRILLLNNFPFIPSVISEKKEMSKAGELRLVFISRIVPHKNLDLALRALEKVKSNVTLYIYGIEENHAYWVGCKKIIARLPQNISVFYMGYKTYDQLAKVMKEYDALILPSKSENYGHTIVEAMHLGVVPIISNRTPWQDLEKNDAGYALDLKEELFADSIEKLANMDETAKLQMSGNAQSFIAREINVDAIKRSYIQTFDYIMNSVGMKNK